MSKIPLVKEIFQLLWTLHKSRAINIDATGFGSGLRCRLVVATIQECWLGYFYSFAYEL